MEKVIVNNKEYNIYGIDNLSLNYYQILPQKNNEDYYLSLDKMYSSKELNTVKDILKDMDKHVKGIFFADFGVLTIKEELKLELDLIYAHPHLLTNPESANTLKQFNIDKVLLTNDLNKKEINDFLDNYEGTAYMMVLGRPEIFYSKRMLLSSYYKESTKTTKNIIDKGVKYIVSETNSGTLVYPKEIVSYLEIFSERKDFVPVIDCSSLPDGDLLSVTKFLKEETSNYKLTIPTTSGLLNREIIYKVKK